MINSKLYPYEDLLYRSIKLLEQHLKSHQEKTLDLEFDRESQQLINEWRVVNTNRIYQETKLK